MATITLVGTRLATEGTEFVYDGPAADCDDCPYRDQCLTLTAGRRYEIVGVRDGASTLDCAVHDAGVTAVEVEPAPLRANVPASSAFAGSKVSLAGSCPHTDCPSHEYCDPDGMDFETTLRIDDVVGDPPHDYCHLDRDLTLVDLEAPEDA